MRAVLDPNILIAALLSRQSAPALIVRRWLRGDFELVVSEALLAELRRALAYPKLRARVAEQHAAEFISLLASTAIVAVDPPAPPRLCVDPGDDYLIALAQNERALLVTGDQHLLSLTDLPIQTARAFVDTLDADR